MKTRTVVLLIIWAGLTVMLAASLVSGIVVSRHQYAQLCQDVNAESKWMLKHPVVTRNGDGAPFTWCGVR
jgi:hypothetical protein